MNSLQIVLESKHENKMKKTQTPGISNDLRIMSDSEQSVKNQNNSSHKKKDMVKYKSQVKAEQGSPSYFALRPKPLVMTTSSESESVSSLDKKSEPEDDTKNNKASVFQMQHLGFDMQKR